MYKLYGYVDSQLVLLLATFYESRVIETMQQYFNPDDVHFMIVKQDKYSIEPYKLILSEKEFNDYIDEYEERIMKNTTALKLKEEILNMRSKTR